MYLKKGKYQLRVSRTLYDEKDTTGAIALCSRDRQFPGLPFPTHHHFERDDCLRQILAGPGLEYIEGSIDIPWFANSASLVSRMEG